ncbi:PH domain-containing protein [Nocardioides sp. CFH 31398]|uniref:PH domain-containing protein n=1 Tax=Nocardioides sp. CFH 31398 TaxID=2919579 RepID=UPI001F065132|nr:PH domain-containing protein [Nocardioides sp. CFH 31398]MCH1865192.1 PH domain-containing protein [Nocardioides sp. CFH 31398]
MTTARRAPLRALVAEYLDGAVALALMLVGVVVAAAADETAVSTASRWLLGVLILARVAVPVVLWATTTCTVAAAGIEVATGLVRRRRRILDWSQLSTVDLHQDWAHRLMGVTRVTVSQNGSESGALRLPSMTTASAERLRARTVGAAPPIERRGSDDVPASTAAGLSMDPTAHPRHGRVVRVRDRDVVVTGLVLGFPVVLGVGAVLAVAEVARTVGLADRAWTGLQLSPVVGGVLLSVLALVLGTAATLLRFGSFETEVHQGSVTIRHGYLARAERRLDRTTVLGLELRQSLFERPLGRWRVLVVSRDSVGGLGRNLALPSLGAADLCEIAAPEWSAVVRSHLSGSEGPGAESNRRVELAGWTLVLAGASVLTGLVAAVADTSALVSAVLWLGAVAAGGAVGLRVTSRLSVSTSTGHLVVWRAFGARRVTWLHGDSLGPVSSGMVAGRAGHLAVSYYAGAPRVARTWRLDGLDVDAVRGLARREAPPRRGHS